MIKNHLIFLIISNVTFNENPKGKDCVQFHFGFK